MKLSYASIENVTPVKMISAVTTYGTGFLTSIVTCFCNLFGTQCEMYDDKIEKAKTASINKLIEKAQSAKATGIMDIKYQIHGITVFVYGIAYTDHSSETGYHKENNSSVMPKSYEYCSPAVTSPSPNGNWKCTCGRENASYVSSCVCGVNKRDLK